MAVFLPGLIMGFREGLEAFLIIVIILQYLNHSKRRDLKKYVFRGSVGGAIASLTIGGILFFVSSFIQKTEEVAKIWESASSLVALIFITTFIYWMIKHGRNMVTEVQEKVKQNLSKTGLMSLAFIMVVREDAEIAIFTFAGKYPFVSIVGGIALALILSLFIYKSLVKINLKLLFNLTLAYLILQAGFLLGYAIHEGLSALKALSVLNGDSLLFIKAFDLSATVFNNKEGVIGIPLYIMFGWYSKPEWIQFLLQYGYSIAMFALWANVAKKDTKQKTSN